MRKAVGKINVKKTEGIIFDSANLNDPESKKQFDQYVQSYMNEVSKDAGPLMLTKTLRDSAGEIKNYSSDDTNKEKRSSQFKFINHKKVSSKDVQNAINEAMEKIVAQAQGRTPQLLHHESGYCLVPQLSLGRLRR